jgi:hypothetical protein
MVLACAYLFSAVMAAVHALSRVASEVAGTTPADGPRAAAVRRAAPQSRGASAFDSKYRIM